MAVDQIRRGMHAGIGTHHENPEIVEALRQGDVAKIKAALPAGVTQADVEEYLKYQHTMLNQGVVQNVQIKAAAGSYPAPDPQTTISPMTGESTLSADDQAFLLQMMSSGARAAEDATLPQQPSEKNKMMSDVEGFGDQMLGRLEQNIGDRDDFFKNLDAQIFQTQMGLDLSRKRDELKQELERIKDMMRKGLINPEFALIALAKVQSAEHGFVFSQMGAQMQQLNKEQSEVAKSIGLIKPTEMGKYEMAKQEMQEKGMSMQQLMSSMQKTTQEIDSILSRTKSMVDLINQTKMDMIRKLST